ncbi:hypothetical protein R6Q59_006843 [Mikania micrantha]
MEAGDKGKALVDFVKTLDVEERNRVTMEDGDKGKALVDFGGNGKIFMEAGEDGRQCCGVDENGYWVGEATYLKRSSGVIMQMDNHEVTGLLSIVASSIQSRRGSSHYQYQSPRLLRIPLEDVEKATNNFHRDNIISRGDFGPAYKGQLLHSGKSIMIAARKLDRKYGLGDVEFWKEISLLSDLKHPNIGSIIGYCDEKNEKIIITTYEAKGSLTGYLNSPNLTWMQRLKISVGVARALSYLHHDKGRDYGVIHRNINSYTILLDQNWEPKLYGFEIAIKQPSNQMDQVVLCEAIGTEGYIDPEIETTRGVTQRSDTYAFGVVLFEILFGRNAFLPKEADRYLAPLAKQHYENKTLMDAINPNIWNQMLGRSLMKYTKSAYSCIMNERAFRANMDDVVTDLEKALEFQSRLEKLPPFMC